MQTPGRSGKFGLVAVMVAVDLTGIYCSLAGRRWKYGRQRLDCGRTQVSVLRRHLNGLVSGSDLNLFDARSIHRKP